MCSYAGPNDYGDKEQVRMISNQVQVKVISDGGYGPFCDITSPSRTACPACPGTREAMAEQENREAMAGLEAREAMADPGTREAMADLEARETMAYFFWAAMVGQGSPWPWLWARPPRQRIYSPPPKIFLGKLPSGGHSGGAGS